MDEAEYQNDDPLRGTSTISTQGWMNIESKLFYTHWASSIRAAEWNMKRTQAALCWAS